MATATKAAQSAPEQRVLLRQVSWETYERLLSDEPDRSVPRLAFDRGVLELMSPSFEHERINRAFASIVELVCDAYGIDFVDAGSMTIRRPDLEKGFEPDTSYYIEHAAEVIDKKRIDATVDPPPDLVIEIDLSSGSMNKFPIYAAMGVPELWRYENDRVAIFHLVGESYVTDPRSRWLPALTSDVLARFVAERLFTKRAVWLRSVQAWLQTQREATDSGHDD